MIAELDDATQAAIDLNNPRRVARAWEVVTATGKSITAWQSETPAPILQLDNTLSLHVAPTKDWLNGRIARRFDIMINTGALDEVAQNIPLWNDLAPASQAIGAPELKKYLDGDYDLDTAKGRATIATHQYAKRQRTWFRKRMKGWNMIDPQTL